MEKVVDRTLILLTFFYVVIGSVGYLSFVELKEFPTYFTNRRKPNGIGNDWMMTIAKVLVSLVCTLKLPLNLAPCRDAILTLWDRGVQSINRFIFGILTIVLLAIAFIVAVAYPNIINILVILGGGLGAAHAFLFPALMQFKIYYEQEQLATL